VGLPTVAVICWVNVGASDIDRVAGRLWVGVADGVRGGITVADGVHVSVGVARSECDCVRVGPSEGLREWVDGREAVGVAFVTVGVTLIQCPHAEASFSLGLAMTEPQTEAKAALGIQV